MENVSVEAPAAAPSDYVAEGSFDDLGLSEPLLRAVAERGYTRPTPVQVATYRPVRDGKDVIVRSKTGTGKTAAFGIAHSRTHPRRAAQALGAGDVPHPRAGAAGGRGDRVLGQAPGPDRW